MEGGGVAVISAKNVKLFFNDLMLFLSLPWSYVGGMIHSRTFMCQKKNQTKKVKHREDFFSFMHSDYLSICLIRLIRPFFFFEGFNIDMDFFLVFCNKIRYICVP